MKKVHRLVVLPDYQGIGLGMKILDFCAEYYSKLGFQFSITTSHPSLNFCLKKQKNWSLNRFGRLKGIDQNRGLNKTASLNRITTSWIYSQI